MFGAESKQVFRTAFMALNYSSQEDYAKLRALGIKTLIDLRTAQEVDADQEWYEATMPRGLDRQSGSGSGGRSPPCLRYSSLTDQFCQLPPLVGRGKILQACSFQLPIGICSLLAGCAGLRRALVVL